MDVGQVLGHRASCMMARALVQDFDVHGVVQSMVRVAKPCAASSIRKHCNRTIQRAAWFMQRRMHNMVMLTKMVDWRLCGVSCVSDSHGCLAMPHCMCNTV